MDTSWVCTQYAIIVLDRQALVKKTVAPESSPYCAASSSALKSYLPSLPQGDLVIVCIGDLTLSIRNQLNRPQGENLFTPITLTIAPSFFILP
jgi:hypothetical protein